MSGIPPPQLREKVRKVFESMRGYLSVWSLEIKTVRRMNSNFVVTGRFTAGILGNWIRFTITVDEDGNVIEAKIEE